MIPTIFLWPRSHSSACQIQSHTLWNWLTRRGWWPVWFILVYLSIHFLFSIHSSKPA